MRARQRGYLALAGLLAGGASTTGCEVLIGIDELTLRRDAGFQGGGGGGDGTGGDLSDSGEVADGGENGEGSIVGNDATSSADAPTDRTAMADSSVDGTALPDATTGSDGPIADGGARDITGKVVDYWGHPLASIPIFLGAANTVTGTDGTFTVPKVTGRYDVRLVSPGGARWVYVGLTRKNPVLQIYSNPNRLQNIDGVISGVTSPLPPESYFAWFFGSNDGAVARRSFPSDDVVDYGYFTANVEWRGPATTSGTMYALSWKASGASGLHSLPTSYLGFASTPLVLDDAMPTKIVPTINLATTPVETRAVSGTIAPPTGVSVTSKVLYGRFGPTAAVLLVDDPTSTVAFSYQAPAVASSTATIAAMTGVYGYSVAVAIAHKSGIAPGTSGIQLAVPAAIKPGLPLDGARDIDITREFSWSGAPGQVYILNVSLPLDDVHVVEYAVVTTESTANIPDFSAGGLALPHGITGEWSVEAHGPFNTVDDATADGTFIDPFAYGDLEGRDRDGTFSWSEHFELTTK